MQCFGGFIAWSVAWKKLSFVVKTAFATVANKPPPRTACLFFMQHPIAWKNPHPASFNRRLIHHHHSAWLAVPHRQDVCRRGFSAFQSKLLHRNQKNKTLDFLNQGILPNIFLSNLVARLQRNTLNTVFQVFDLKTLPPRQRPEPEGRAIMAYHKLKKEDGEQLSDGEHTRPKGNF